MNETNDDDDDEGLQVLLRASVFPVAESKH